MERKIFFWNPKLKIDDAPVIYFKPYALLSSLSYPRTLISDYRGSNG